MAGYVTLGEVRTWCDERGSGALGDSAVFDGNLAARQQSLVGMG